MVISLPGTSGVWRTWYQVRKLPFFKTIRSFCGCIFFPLFLFCVWHWFANVSFNNVLFSLVFTSSGFTRTLCGWPFPPSTGRVGCCSPGTFMAQPNENPFSKALACESCPADQYSSESDDLSCPYTATTCPDGTFAIAPASCGTLVVPISDCTYTSGDDRSCGLRQAVDTYITSGSTGSYGPIEEWNTSLVTDMSRVFQYKGSFNANISAWQVGKVTTMSYSTYIYTLSSPPLQDRVFFWLLLFPFFFLRQALILFLNNALPLLFFNPFLSLDFSLLLLWCSVSWSDCLQW